MLRMHFVSLESEVEIDGFECNRAGWLINNLFHAALGLVDSQVGPERVRQFQKIIVRDQEDNPAHNARSIRLALSAWGDYKNILIQGREVSVLSVALNTAIAIGSDPVRFLARLHGYREIWGWVDGPNRAWLAGVIQDGLSTGILRSDARWEGVVALLLSRNDGPVVAGYGILDTFPCLDMARSGGFKGVVGQSKSDDEGFYNLPYEQQWEYAMNGLRSQHLIEMKPDNWRNYRFGVEYTAFDIIAEMERMEEE